MEDKVLDNATGDALKPYEADGAAAAAACLKAREISFNMFTPPADATLGEGVELGRVIKLDRSLPLVCTKGRTIRCEHSPHFAKGAASTPCVGDWVEVLVPKGHDDAIIEGILPRRNVFRRNDAGGGSEHVLASNIDQVAVVHALGEEPLNMRRLERELVLAFSCTENVILALTKADAAGDASRDLRLAESALGAGRAFVCSSRSGEGIDELEACMHPGTLTAIFGASGVGKSTLINKMLGYERQATGAVRTRDGKGRHTTVAREMVALEAGGLIVDMPGVRSLSLFCDFDALNAVFPDISKVAFGCRFRDCMHGGEPGCAVREAVHAGKVAEQRLDSYISLKDEMIKAAQSLAERERVLKRGRRQGFCT